MAEENKDRRQKTQEEIQGKHLQEDSKSYSLSTWVLLVGSLGIFFVMTLILSAYLDNFAPWRPVVPVIIGFAVFFFVVGVFLRTKFGRLAL